MTRRRLTLIATAVAGVVVLLAVVAAAFDWGLLRGTAERRLSAALDRPVTIVGMRRIDSFGLTPHLRLEGVIIGQPGWAGTGDMLTATRIDLRLPVWPLLGGRVLPQDVRVSGVRATLLHRTDGKASWKFGAPKEESGAHPLSYALTIADAQVKLIDDKRHLMLTASVASDAKGFRVRGQGNLRGAPLSLTFDGAALDGRDVDAAYPFRAAIRSALVGMELDGTMAGKLAIGKFTAKASSSGEDLTYLDDIILAGLPGTQRYRIAGTVARVAPDWKLPKLAGSIGRSTLDGALTIDKRDGRSIIKGHLDSSQLDFDDLASNEGLKRAAEKRRVYGRRVIPDTAIDLTHLKKTDGELRFTIAKLLLPGRSPFRSARGTFKLDHSKLALDPLTVGLAHGVLAGKASVDHRETLPKLAIDMHIENGRLADLLAADPPGDAPLAGFIRLWGSGKTVRQAMAKGDGEVALVIGEGWIRKSTAAFLGADLGRGLFAGKEDRSVLRCAVARFRGARGQFRADPFVIDTSVSRAELTGTVDLADERIDMTMAGRSKGGKFLGLPAPIEVKGILADPQVGLVKHSGDIFTKIGRVLGIGHEAPQVQDVDCAALVQRVR